MIRTVLAASIVSSAAVLACSASPEAQSPSYLERDFAAGGHVHLDLSAGQYEIAARMRDTPRTEGFDHQRKETVTLVSDQMFVVDFRAESGGFVFR